MATIKATTNKAADTASASAEAKGRSGVAGMTFKVNLAEVRKEARKPMYAYIGASDYAVERLRKLPESVSHARTNYRTAFKVDIPGSVKDLPSRSRERYDEFAERGERLVLKIRRQPAAKKAVSEAKSAVSQTRSAATHASRSLRSAEKAAEGAAHKIAEDTAPKTPRAAAPKAAENGTKAS